MIVNGKDPYKALELAIKFKSCDDISDTLSIADKILDWAEAKIKKPATLTPRRYTEPKIGASYNLDEDIPF